MAELTLGSAVIWNAARSRIGGRGQAASEVPVFVGAMADQVSDLVLRQRRSRISVARRRLARCDMPPLVVCW